MANAISSFDLERLAKTFGVRIWLCRRVGRRWSFIEGAGIEKLLPSQLLYESSDTGVFVQGEEFDEQALAGEIKNLLSPAVIV